MPSLQRVASWCVWGSCGLPLLLAMMAVADDPVATKPSVYAPVKDVVSAMDTLMERMSEDLASPDGYAADQQKRVAMDANTVAALALVLGKHDTEHPRKGGAAAIVAAAAKLGEESGQYAAARKQLDVLREAIRSAGEQSGKKSEELSWEPVADIQQLMRQVPIVNNSLRRGVTGRRFAREREIENNLQYSATLAAIAQASMFDTSYCEDEAAGRKWAAICADMRDAAAAVNRAVRESDQQTATKHLERLVETCDACHHAFRD